MGRRTVHVRDTLPPVITLHLADQLIHAGGTTKQLDANGNPIFVPDDVGVNHHEVNGDVDPDTHAAQYNPAGYTQANPYQPSAGYTNFGNPNIPLMAEVLSSHGGWLTGAAACAVAGLAMLAFAYRSNNNNRAVLDVPV